MTLTEAIYHIDTLKHNTCTQLEKRAWLSQLDAMVRNLVLDTHEGAFAPFYGYTGQTPGDTQLLIPDDFFPVYRYWLEAQIDYANGELVRFNNASALFAAHWRQFADHYHRTHAPKTAANRFR